MSTTTPVQPKPVRLFRPLAGKRFDALVALIGRYHKEARRAAKARAYYAACVLIGSALEGSLLAMCTLREADVEAHLSALPANRRPPRTAEDWTLNQLLAVAAALRWFPARSSKHSRRRLAEWTHLVREMRNLVHPGKHIRDYPGVRLVKAHWRDAKAIARLANDSLLDLVHADLRADMRKRGIVPRS
jgi:hypothetical protein